MTSEEEAQKAWEKSLHDAPIELANEEASSWASGYNSAIRDFKASLKAEIKKEMDEFPEVDLTESDALGFAALKLVYAMIDNCRPKD